MSEKKFKDMDLQDYQDILAAISSSPARPESLRVFMNCAITEGGDTKVNYLKDMIDEMIGKEKTLADYWHPTEERYIAERFEDAISKLAILTELRSKL